MKYGMLLPGCSLASDGTNQHVRNMLFKLFPQLIQTKDKDQKYVDIHRSGKALTMIYAADKWTDMLVISHKHTRTPLRTHTVTRTHTPDDAS